MLWAWSLYLSLVAVSFLGLALAVLGLPGIWLIVIAAAGYACWTGAAHLIWCVGVLAALGGIAEFLETALGGVAAKNAGGSKRGMVGAIAGGLIGGLLGTAIPIFIVGTLIGACAGAFLGAFAIEFLWLRKTANDALAIGVASAKGRLYGMLVKLLFGGAMLATVAIWALPSWYPRPANASVAPALPAPETDIPSTTLTTMRTTMPGRTTSPAPEKPPASVPTTRP